MKTKDEVYAFLRDCINRGRIEFGYPWKCEFYQVTVGADEEKYRELGTFFDDRRRANVPVRVYGNWYTNAWEPTHGVAIEIFNELKPWLEEEAKKGNIFARNALLNSPKEAA